MRLDRHTFARSLMTAGIATALSFAALSASAAADLAHQHAQAVTSAASTTAAEARHKAYDHTQTLMALQKQWANAKGADKSRALEQLKAKAEERRAYLLDLMDTNPAEVLRVAIPEDKQVDMPAEVLEKLEQPLKTEGELEVIYEDYDDGSHKLRQFLKTPFGERFELGFAGNRPQLQSGQQVRAQGIFINGETATSESLDGVLLLDSQKETILTLDADGDATGGSNGGTPAVLPNTLGEQRTLVLLVNFQDQPDNKPWTLSQYHNLVFGEANAYFQEASYGKTWLSGDVFGWYTLPIDSTTCDHWGIGNAAIAEANAAGVDVAGYDRLVFAFPYNANCTWSGKGSVGGSPSSAWINGMDQLRTVGHEIGHNLGLHHANNLECGTASIGDNCSVGIYGDKLDIMGGAATGHYNAYSKDRLGWLNANDASLVTVDTPGSYELTALESTLDGKAKALKILKGVDTTSGDKTWYYLELRQAIGFDDFLAGNTNVVNGVTMHTGQEQDGNSSFLLDMTPDSGWPAEADWLDTALVEGQNFSDTGAGVTVTTSWVTGNSATVDVDLGPQPCAPAAPAITLSSPVSKWVSAGTAVTYTFTVTNRDSAQCSATTFNLSTGVPTDWSSNLSTNSLTLAPGGSTSVSLTVASPENAADGYYSVSVAAANNVGTATATATYVVDTPALNSVPVAVDDSVVTSENTAVKLSVLNNDTDADGDTLTVTATGNASHGSVAINSDQSLTYTPNANFSGSDTFSYSIGDGRGGSDSATVTIEVAAIPSPEPINTAPVAVDDNVSLDSKSAVTLAVLGNDWDPENDSLSIISFTQGSKGDVSLNADGTLRYTPAKQLKNSDTFSYTISDGKLSATASVTVQLQSSGTGSSGGGKGKGPSK